MSETPLDKAEIWKLFQTGNSGGGYIQENEDNGHIKVGADLLACSFISAELSTTDGSETSKQAGRRISRHYAT